jgi:hypothetical protein
MNARRFPPPASIKHYWAASVVKGAQMRPRFLNKDESAQAVRNTPLVSIDLIIRDPDQYVLVGLRTNEPAKGKWFVPGSVVRKYERLADARSLGSSKLSLGLGRQLMMQDSSASTNTRTTATFSGRKSLARTTSCWRTS